MNIVIIEDEPLAAQKVAGFVQRFFPEASITATLDKVKDVIAYFEAAADTDLILSDIELLDGPVFDALNQLDVPCPIVFTTSYNQYWMDAFSHQGIEYLLKPFTYKRFAEAMSKYQTLKAQFAPPQPAELSVQTRYKSRFLLKKSAATEILKVEDVVCFKTVAGVMLAYDIKDQSHVLSNSTVNELQEQLNPSDFFRINRSDIIQLKYIERFEAYGKDTLAVYCQTLQEPLLTSKTRTAEFKKWLDS